MTLRKQKSLLQNDWLNFLLNIQGEGGVKEVLKDKLNSIWNMGKESLCTQVLRIKFESILHLIVTDFVKLWPCSLK